MALHALTFDPYGTLFDKEAASSLIDEQVPGRAAYGLAEEIGFVLSNSSDLMALAERRRPVRSGASRAAARRVESS